MGLIGCVDERIGGCKKVRDFVLRRYIKRCIEGMHYPVIFF